jgi:hypothetical protein
MLVESYYIERLIRLSCNTREQIIISMQWFFKRLQEKLQKATNAVLLAKLRLPSTTATSLMKETGDLYPAPFIELS